MREVISDILEGVHAVTVNARLARLIRNAFDRHMLDLGKEGWPTPTIIPLKGWFEMLWDGVWEKKKPYLNKLRGKMLWEKIISQDERLHSFSFINRADMAEEAWGAYEIFRNYRLPLSPESIYSSKETLLFNRWLEKYQNMLESLGFIDIYDMRDRVIEAVRSGELAMPKELRLVGFQEITPEVTSFIEAIRRQGSRVEFVSSDPLDEEWRSFKVEELSDRISVRRYADITDEVSQCARWIRSIYSDDKKIGIVVPDLTKYRNVIDKEFAAELDPASVIILTGQRERYNISLGQRLPEIPIIWAALQVLSLGNGKTDLEQIEYLIANPYIAGAEEEFLERGKLVYLLRDANYYKISISELSIFISKNKISLPIFSSLLKKMISHFSNWRREENRPSCWGKLFGDFLKDLGWGFVANGISLRSEEYQAVESWMKLLSTFSTLDEILGEMRYKDACGKLSSVAGGQLYQPAGYDSPVQVLGMLESSGIDLDHLWIMGAVEGVLPAKARPNPFLPIDIQKKYRTPHSTPDREFEFAKKNIVDLLERGKDIVISYPGMDASVESSLSPIFRGLEFSERDTPMILEGNRIIDKSRLSNTTLEEIEDGELAVTEEEIAHIRGGTSIARDQSSCPFKSFASHRLHASEWPRVLMGINSLERGSLIHGALELFWRETKNKETLDILYENGEIETKISEAVEEAFNSFKQTVFSERYLILEKSGLKTLLAEWLEAERNRESFDVVSLEEKKEVSIEGLKLRIKADRIDKFPDGGKIVVDYKSGQCSPRNWEGDRPKEPQMMIYAMHGNYSAVTFARVKRGETKFRGISKAGDGEFVSPKKDSGFSEGDWDTMMEHWREAVENLFSQFMSGEASVDPRSGDGGEDCKYCPYPSLCRKAELLV